VNKILLEDDYCEGSLEVLRDDQGDLHLRIRNQDGSFSDTVRFCGPPGGSRHRGLAGRLARIFFPSLFEET
jgi:hypothetical protein